MNVTRGSGLLENFLAKKRAKVADGLIADNLRNGKILDIGCGNYPYFLSNIKFNEKYGLDKDFVNIIDNKEIKLIRQNIEKDFIINLPDNYFNVITMLAFLEHLEGEIAKKVLKEAYRVLAPRGNLIITVPRDISDSILKFLANIGLVSKIEINEHKQLYNKEILKEQLLNADFRGHNIKIGSFEFGLNLFAIAKK